MSLIVAILFLLVLGECQTIWALGLFSGTELAQADQGVKLLNVYPGYPAERAGLQVGDIILEINGQKIKTVEEFISISKSMGNKLAEANLLVMRRGRLENRLIFNYSEVVYKEWGEKVQPPPEGNVRMFSLFQYYKEKGRVKLEENKKAGGPFETQLARSEEAIKYFFYSLHYAPTDVGVALLIADTYKDTAKLCLDNDKRLQAVENYSKAATLYERCSKRHITEKELEFIFARLQEVEKALMGLLPSEERGTISLERTSAETLPDKASP